MTGRYLLLSVAGLSVLQYFLLTGIRAERVVTDQAARIRGEATRSFSKLVDLISDSRSGLHGSFLADDESEPEAAPPLQITDGEASTMIFAKDDYLQQLIEHYADYYQIDPLLVRLIIEQESGFDPLALSPSGAMGLMQLMPDTAWLLGVDDPFDPEQNIEGGVRYFAQQMDHFGSVELALAAYNAGPGAVETWGGVPPYPETVDYVNSIMNRYLEQSTPAVDPEAVEAAEAAEAADPTPPDEFGAPRD
jgi:soluble lytic murein transglycosylase-like protein